MKIISAFSVIAGLVAGLQVAAAGDITGTITLKGTPKPELEITQIKDDAFCGKLHTEAVKTRFYVVGAKGELADVFVTLKGLSGKSTGASAEPAMIDQKGCEYIPYVMAVQTGQKIVVKNSDPVMHNIHPTPAVAGNDEVNKAQMPGGADLSLSFPTAENFLKVKCDIHPWMFSYVSVVDHPYFAVSGKDGSFTIKNVPPGKYTLVAMHRKAAATGVEKEIEVKADGAKADFTLEAK
jgi:plastocyanin